METASTLCFTGRCPLFACPGTKGAPGRTFRLQTICQDSAQEGSSVSWTVKTGTLVLAQTGPWGVAGLAYVYWTHDGGETWTSSTELYEEAMMLDGLAFSDTSHGVASSRQ